MSDHDDYPGEMNAYDGDEELLEQVALGQLRFTDGDPLAGVLDELWALRSAPAPAMSSALSAALASETWETPEVTKMTAAAAGRARKGVSGYLPYAVVAAAAAVIFALGHGNLVGAKRTTDNYVATDPHRVTITPGDEPGVTAPTATPEARQGDGRSTTYSAPANGGSSTPVSNPGTGTSVPDPAVAPPLVPTVTPPAEVPEANNQDLLQGVVSTVAAVLAVPVDLLS